MRRGDRVVVTENMPMRAEEGERGSYRYDASKFWGEQFGHWHAVLLDAGREVALPPGTFRKLTKEEADAEG